MVTSVSVLGGDFGDFGVLGVVGESPDSSSLVEGEPPSESRDELRALPLIRVELSSRIEVRALEATWHSASQTPRMKFIFYFLRLAASWIGSPPASGLAGSPAFFQKICAASVAVSE